MRTYQFIFVLLLAVIADGFIVTGFLHLYCNQPKVARQKDIETGLKPFSSHEEVNIAYRILLKNEQKLSNPIRFLIDLFAGSPMLATHHKELKVFYKKLFKFIVKKEYPVCSGLLFPKIVVLENNTTEINTNTGACYNHKKNRILIRKKDVSITNCLTFLHEFAHCLQYINDTTATTHYKQGKPLVHQKNVLDRIKCEIDAELFSIMHHPDPEHLLKQLEEHMRYYTDDTEETEKHFPYFTSPQKYAKALDFFKLKGNLKWEKLAIKAYKERENLEKNIPKMWDQAYEEGDLSMLNKYPIYFRLRFIGSL